MSAQEALNTIWYRFALYTAKKVGRWPNYTTGKLYDPLSQQRIIGSCLCPEAEWWHCTPGAESEIQIGMNQ